MDPYISFVIAADDHNPIPTGKACCNYFLTQAGYSRN